MRDLICRHCGKTNLPDEAYCESCKQPLFEESADGSDSLQNLPASPVNPPDEVQQVPDESTPDSATPNGEDDVPEWLSRIRQRAHEDLGEEDTDDQEGMAPYSNNQEDLPDWLKEFKDIQPSGDEEPTVQIPGSTWIDGFPSLEDTPPTDSEPVELPEWLDITQPRAEAEGEIPTSDEENLDLWKDNPFESKNASGAEEEPSDDDWLLAFNRLQPMKSQEETGQPAPPSPEQSEGEDSVGSDWLSTFASYEGETQAEDETSAPESEDETAPDWLTSFASFGNPEPNEDKAPTPESEDETAPDWLASFASFGNPEPNEDKAPTSESEDGTAPGGLSQFAGDEAKTLPPEVPSEEEAAASDWMTQFPPEQRPKTVSDEEEPSLHPMTSEIEASSEETYDSNKFSELFSEVEPVLKDGEVIPPFTSVGLPDWFTDQSSQGVLQENESVAEESETLLEPAQLPGWLQAIRPLDEEALSGTIKDSDQQFEPSGPLAGYQGILPGDAVVTRLKKPPIYAVTLQVSEKQRLYAALLENLMNEEKGVKPAIKEKSAIPQIIGRLVVGVIILALLAFMLLSGIRVTTLPTIFPPETVEFFTQIERLRASDQNPAQVLLVIDYEAALSGELKTISTGVMRDLLVSDTRLAIVSIAPAGPALANDLLTTALVNSPPLEQVINLGFLPGGTTGMAALALHPAQALPVDLDGKFAWDHPALDGITQLSDFDAVLLLSDNAENSRGWIEQLGPSLAQKPLLVISSAQSAPMLQPFVNSRQISGLLAGLPGGASYSQLTQRPDPTIRSYWDTYQAGMLLITILILAGSLYYGSRQILNSRKPETKV